MNAKGRARQICAQFETYAYLPDLEPLIEAGIQEAEREMMERCAQVAYRAFKKYREDAQHASSIDQEEFCRDVQPILQEIAEDIRALKDNR